MRTLSADDADRLLDYPSLIEAVRNIFKSDAVAPKRHHHQVRVPGGDDATLLLMPAWRVGEHIGVKIATVFPDNGQRTLPAVMANYLLLDGNTGEPHALIDGVSLTRRRTAAASALAASFLAREDARNLLMVGTGALAPQLVEAHAAVRPIEKVQVWGRTSAKAAALAGQLSRLGLEVIATEEIEIAARLSDVICCATLTFGPLVFGEWLKPGTHLDLVGGFTRERREADDEAVRRSRILVDTRAALEEAGDLAQPIEDGLLRPGDVVADLFDLCRGVARGRESDEEITLFKSVGHALEDLAAARLAFERSRA